MRLVVGLLVLSACADPAADLKVCADCGSADASASDAARAGDARRDASVPIDASPADAAPASAAQDAAPRADAGGCDEALSPGATRLWPERGELYYVQLGLPGFSLGETAIVVGPDGTTVLIDVANDSHDDNIRAALRLLSTEMSARGFGPRAADSVDHIILTHNHADHVGGLEDLLANVSVAGGIMHRGRFDVGNANPNVLETVCRTLEAHRSLERPLCVGPAAAPCSEASWTGTYPASSCLAPGVGRVDFGATSALEVVAVDGHIAGHGFEVELGPFATDDSNGENARSVVGLIRHGPFTLLFNGDLTGGGSDTDDVERFYVPHLERAAGIDALGIDVLHAGHHGRNTSTRATWADRLLPNDGLARSVVMGISRGHANSPHTEVLDTIFDGRLAGGRGWTTRIAPLGSTHPRLQDAGGGSIVIRTLRGGEVYEVQAIAEDGSVRAAARHFSVRACR